MPEHLPHDQQGLLGHGSRRPQVARDPVRLGGALFENVENATAPASVLLDSAADQADMVVDRIPVTGQQSSSGIDAVRCRFARYSTRARGRDPVGSATGTISALEEIPANR